MPTALTDTSRIDRVYSRDKFGDEREVHFIGLGVTGGYGCNQAAKTLGLGRQIIGWDHDVVAVENLCNQIYWPSHAELMIRGNEAAPRALFKAEAMEQITHCTTGLPITPRVKRFTPGEDDVSGIVFLMLDSMTERDKIWHGALKLNPRVELVIDFWTTLGDLRARRRPPDRGKEAL